VGPGQTGCKQRGVCCQSPVVNPLRLHDAAGSPQDARCVVGVAELQRKVLPRRMVIDRVQHCVSGGQVGASCTLGACERHTPCSVRAACWRCFIFAVTALLAPPVAPVVPNPGFVAHKLEDMKYLANFFRAPRRECRGGNTAKDGVPSGAGASAARASGALGRRALARRALCGGTARTTQGRWLTNEFQASIGETGTQCGA
jgi:hypothetical protein